MLNPEQKQKTNGSVCRVIKSKDYTTISNIHLRDKSLSLKAKGLLSMVLSLPEDWNYSISGLVSLVQEGEFAVRNTLKELKEHKYLLIRKIMPNTETKILTYEYVFFESPRLYSQDVSYQGVGNQHLDNSPQLNIYKQNKDKLNKEIIISKPEKPVARKRSSLQVFSNAVLESFEPEVKTDTQKEVWFRRNCRNLKDILSYCNNDIEAAMFTINKTCKWLEENNLSGGYEAVCRNLPEMYSKALKELDNGTRWVFSSQINQQIQDLQRDSIKSNKDMVRNNKNQLYAEFDSFTKSVKGESK